MSVVEPGPRQLTPASGAPDAPAHFSAPAPRSRRASAVALTAGWVVAALSALALWGLAYVHVFSAVQEHRSQTVLHAQLREQLAKQTSAIGGVIPTRAPLAFLRVPSIGIHNAVIVEGTSAGTLETGPGHRRDTALPGQPGVSVVMGRSVMFGAPFDRVTSLRVGAPVTVETGQGVFTYRVERVRRAGDSLPQPLDAGASRLTLITSERHGWTRRTVFVDALLHGKSQVPPTTHHTTTIRASEAAFGGDARALLPLVVWLAALGVAAAALVWLWSRWGRYQSLLVGVPTLVACAWGVSQTAVRLLPNLL